MPTRVVVIGATGSIGSQALDIIGRFPERFELVGAVAGRRVAALQAALAPFSEAQAVLIDPDGPVPPGVLVGSDAACQLASSGEVDVVLVGGGGAGALLPTLAACRAGRLVALATKEVLVMAGELVTTTAREHGARIVPVDSEHSAIWQCLRGERRDSVRRLILTASGGALRSLPLAQLLQASPEQALAHPNWRMGPKVTVDTATMVNKGLEVIEAHFLFDIPYEQIEVVIHPQSTVHSAVEFCDGTMIAQLGVADMRAPIALALTDGVRLPGVVAPLELAQVGRLDFEAVDLERYPALQVVRDAGIRGGAFPAVMNAANEAAVAAFLEGRLQFMEIARLVEQITRSYEPSASPGLQELVEADGWARQQAGQLVARLATPARGAVPV
ncbi:MAG TPA: 1-deoxy-D-xylulose-5-phosphate reductoisomerase [Candidatus Micrarchaeaceae archaeon]|nr:1-deoxy-D-xylulose-5-phosphate reductoisomerase [Candidatus Micrarchaeaceae archaeon]